VATADLFGTTLSKSGIDGGDGWIVVLAAGGGIACMFTTNAKAKLWGPPAAGILLAVLGVVEYGMFRSKLAEDSSGIASGIVHVGIGLPLLILGGAGAAFAAWPRKPTATVPAPPPSQTIPAPPAPTPSADGPRPLEQPPTP
jgi:hypothetical protein